MGSIEAARAEVSEATLMERLTLNSIYFPYNSDDLKVLPGEPKPASKK